jgi:uncharacterized protein YgiM (DUF1202 family)
VAVFFNFVLPILAGISIIALLVFFLRALSARSKMSSQAYGVGQVETRQKAQANLLAALVSFILALIFLALIFVGPRVMASLPQPTPTLPPTAVPATVAPTETATVTSVPTQLQPTPTSPVPTATATSLPTDTPTPAPLTATVSSGVGIYLRSEPGTNSAELQYLEDGTTLFVLDAQQSAEDLLWQQVQTDTGQVGWVAVDFITINEP